MPSSMPASRAEASSATNCGYAAFALPAVPVAACARSTAVRLDVLARSRASASSSNNTLFFFNRDQDTRSTIEKSWQLSNCIRPAVQDGFALGSKNGTQFFGVARLRFRCVVVSQSETRYFCSAEAAKVGHPEQREHTTSTTSPNSSASDYVSDRKVVDTLIVGAGLSGLSLAFNLVKNGGNVLVAESRDRVGGAVESLQANGFQWEAGPNSFQPSAGLMKFVLDVGLQDDLVLADGTLPRFVYWDGILHPLPMSPKDINFKLLSWPGKVRAGLGAIGFVRPSFKKEESISDFVRRHLGDEAFEKLIDPFCSGVYAGDPTQLSVEAAFGKLANLEKLGGSLMAGAVKLFMERRKGPRPTLDPRAPRAKAGELGSFRQGLSVLPERVSSILGGERVKLEWAITSVQPTDDGTFKAEFATPEGPRTVESKTVVLTSPAYITANLVEPLHSDASKALSEIYYPPVASVTLAYPDSAFRAPLRGFGNLLPRSQKIRTLGTIWGSCLFPGIAPEGWSVLTSFIGGAQDTAIGDLSDAEIAAAVHADVRKVLLREDVQPKVLGVRLWRRAIPQMNLGHQSRIERARDLEKAYPGLFLSGNYVNGVSIGNCIEAGAELAPRVLAALETKV